MISAEEIQGLYAERKKAGAPHFARWAELAELANGDTRVPVAELDQEERATVVNLFPGGLDGLATRAASVQPDQVWPPLKDGIDVSENKARARRLAGLDWWSQSNMTLADYERFRYHFGYGCMPVIISPASESPLDKREMPHWRIPDPRTVFPAPTGSKLNMQPVDCIVASRRSRSWLDANYKGQMMALSAGPRGQRRPDDLFDVLEYIDCEEIVLVCCGMSKPSAGLWTPSGEVAGAAAVVLERYANKSGVPLIVYPRRITLDRCQGALDQMIPAYRQSAILQALNTIAITRGIFQDQYLQGHPSDPQSPELIQQANGVLGIMGEVAHGTINTIGPAVGAAQMADMAIDRLERSQRLAAGLPAEMGGESGSNIRTARRGEQVLGSAIDMPIQEAQEIMEVSKKIELQYAVAVTKGWWGNKQFSFYVPQKGDNPRRVDYVPNDTFETDEVYVKYSMPGVDSAGVPIELGQRVNMGTMSIQTARESDPLIEDPTQERDRVESESLIRSLLQSIDQGVAQGTVQPNQVAAIIKAKMSSHDNLADVVIRVHEEMQAKQAAQQQLAPGAPGAQPGLGGAQPPVGGAAPNPFSGPPSSPALAQILGNLRAPAAQGQAEQGTPPAPSPVMAGQ